MISNIFLGVVGAANIEGQLSNIMQNMEPANNQYIMEIFTTFLGFALAILGEKLYDSYKDVSESRRLITSFKSEFQKISENIGIIDATPVARWIKPIKTPVWDSAISADKIALIDSREWFPLLCDLYDDIRDYNEWQLLRTNYFYFGREEFPEEINIALEKTKGDIIDKINNLKKFMTY